MKEEDLSHILEDFSFDFRKSRQDLIMLDIMWKKNSVPFVGNVILNRKGNYTTALIRKSFDSDNYKHYFLVYYGLHFGKLRKLKIKNRKDDISSFYSANDNPELRKDYSMAKLGNEGGLYEMHKLTISTINFHFWIRKKAGVNGNLESAVKTLEDWSSYISNYDKFIL